MAFQSRLPSRLPSALDWRSLAALLARDARPGDAVALSPWWAERARGVVPATLPVLAFPRFAGEDLVGVRRVWLVALPDAPGHRWEVEDDLAARAAAMADTVRLGELAVTRYDLRGPTLPLAFLPDRLARASVALGETACAPDGGGGFRCPGSRATVAREEREVEGLPRPCIVALPPPGGAALRVTFPGVPLGRALRGHLGVVGEAALGGSGPVRLAVSLDGREVGRAQLPPRDPSWRAFQVDTVLEAGRTREVALTLALEGEPRPVCLDAYVLP